MFGRLFALTLALTALPALAADVHLSCQLLHCESVDPVNDAPSGACMRVRFFRFTVREGRACGTLNASRDGKSWGEDAEAVARFTTNPSTGVFLESRNKDVPVYAFIPYEAADTGGFRPSSIRTGMMLYRPWDFGTAFTKAIFQCKEEKR